MKKSIALMLSAIMMLAIAGCSNKKNDTAGNSAPESTQTQTQNNDVAGTALENASKEVDMDKVNGKELADTEVDDADEAVIGGYEVAIEDAKVIDYNEEKVLILSFDFDNNTPSPIAFDGAMTVDVFQNESKLRGTVVTGIEGVNINSAFETVKSGDDITLQKAYVIEDETTPVNVSVYKYGESDGATVTKTFNLQ